MNTLEAFERIEELSSILNNLEYTIWAIERLEKNVDFSSDFVLKNYLKLNKEEFSYFTNYIDNFRKKLSQIEFE